MRWNRHRFDISTSIDASTAKLPSQAGHEGVLLRPSSKPEDADGDIAIYFFGIIANVTVWSRKSKWF